MSKLTTTNSAVALKLNEAVGSVLNQTNLIGFEKAYATAESIKTLKSLLTPEYMAPILELQGNRLGFKTDRDKTGGYPEEVVKNCLIEAVLMGLQPYGNMINIIAGNTYVTKEGCGEILSKFPGLSYTIITGTPRAAIDQKTAVIDVEINWTLNGKEQTKTIPISVKMDSYTTVDAMKGKATRKSRAWLIEAVTGIEVADGDIQDIAHEVVTTRVNPQQVAANKGEDKVLDHIEKATTLNLLHRCFSQIKPDNDKLLSAYMAKARPMVFVHIDEAADLETLKFADHAIANDDEELMLKYDEKKRALQSAK